MIVTFFGQIYRVHCIHWCVVLNIYNNMMLLQMKKYQRERDGLSYIQIREMLEASIIRGVQLDQEQFTLLSTVDSTTANEILKKYQKPY